MAGDDYYSKKLRKKFPEFYAASDYDKVQQIGTGMGLGAVGMAGGLFAYLKHQENKEIKKNLKRKKLKQKQKQSMTLDSAYSTKNKNYGETDLLK
jgi:dipeptide/tripeptide permease